jgi:hypothetical protein
MPNRKALPRIDHPGTVGTQLTRPLSCGLGWSFAYSILRCLDPHSLSASHLFEPRAGCHADAALEAPTEMTLICETSRNRGIGKRMPTQ